MTSWCPVPEKVICTFLSSAVQENVVMPVCSQSAVHTEPKQYTAIAVSSSPLPLQVLLLT